MDGYSVNPTGTNTSVPPQQPSPWEASTQKVQSLHPLSSLLGQAGNDFGQRTINLLHGDGFRTDSQAYPLQPPSPLPRASTNPPVNGGAATSGAAPRQTAYSGGGQGGAMGYAHALADNLGVAPILHQVRHPIQTMSGMQQQAAADQHPFQTALNRATIDNPMSGIPELRGLAGTAMNSLTETGQALGDLGVTPYGYQTPKYGPNYAGAVVHAAKAVPVLGDGLRTAMHYAAQNGMGDPGNSYLQDVGKVWSSPRAMGTLTGMALQVAPLVEGGARRAGWGRPLNAAADAVPRSLDLVRGAAPGDTSMSPEAPYPTDLLKSNLSPDEIGAWLKNSNIPYRSMRQDVWVGNINRNIDLLNEGQVAPPIRVIGGDVWNGNHRIVAGDIHGTMPTEIPQVHSGVAPIPESGTRSFRELKVRPGFKPGD
ncbi:hypothetical protein [Granulicella mallensis]|uniref:Uncharacterized protein n=1 Tax=Granulicella mallensis (strain ATCC BAA-1857 / DSM 23137 / MP5ACTX8) TaxID=682795 RepID=G8NQQ9_GRAMM|nr:hypothetical protein [Granulicella mallensis]AEU37285.1 hypothetical protein AciX8_2982 [Granulicella mallensis MP5ACTX8]